MLRSMLGRDNKQNHSTEQRVPGAQEQVRLSPLDDPSASKVRYRSILRTIFQPRPRPPLPLPTPEVVRRVDVVPLVLLIVEVSPT
jgi:hypothetical protein